VGIVTDSSCDLPEEIIRAHGIKVVPMGLIRGDESLRDGIDISAEDFHQALREKDHLPTTSQPAPGAFLDAYQKASEESEAVVGILVGSNLSGTFGAAEAAAFSFEGVPIHLMDSLGASLLQGLLVLKAAEMAELAVRPDEIVEELERIRRQSGIFLTVDTFDRLMASGRVGRGKAWLASTFGIKPLMWVPNDGRATEPAGMALGRKRLISNVIRALRRKLPPEVHKIRFGIAHVGYPEIIEPVSERIREEYGDVEIISAPATPVIATHTGIGAWGLGFILED
jgi:DegV family protein with EDD domain